MHKYGREFSLGAMENRDSCVSDRVRLLDTDRGLTSDLIPSKVMKKLVLSTPPPELVDAYLFEIAKGYGVSWNPPTPLNVTEPKEVEMDGKVCPVICCPHPFHI